MAYKNVYFKYLPQCCKQCSNIESDSENEYEYSYYYCKKGLFIPVKKETCSKQTPPKK